MSTEVLANIPQYSGAISPDFKIKAKKAYDEYKADKEGLKNRIIENYRYYKSQHGIKFDAVKNKPKTTTEYIFNAIENKYADALDNFPEASVLEREEADSKVAEVLSKILPVQMDMSRFKKAYKENWRRKMKSGTGIYFIDYDHDTDEIAINSVNVLSFFADFNVSDIQESAFIFVTRAEDNAELRVKYPQFSACFQGDCNLDTIEGTKTLSDRTEIIDCYYKKLIKGEDGKIKTTVHMMKLAGEVIIDASEDIPGYENGMYTHGKYPFVLDVMYPNEDCPFGFGVIDVVKGIQEFIDKLDASIEKNTLIASKVRYMIKDNAGLNADDLADVSKDVIYASGNLDEIMRELTVSGLPAQVVNYRDRKIEELKEIIGNRDFQQGGNAGGVTSGSAIELLQRSGEKMSRATIDDSFDAYKEICIMVIELMRQFFSESRVYRITGDNGEKEFVSFSSADLGKDAFGFPDDKKPMHFDVSITAQKSNPYTKQGNNATLSELWKQGVFNLQNLDSSILLIRNMQFDGKEKLLQDLQNKQAEVQQAAQEQQQMAIPQQPMSGEELVGIPI